MQPFGKPSPLSPEHSLWPLPIPSWYRQWFPEYPQCERDLLRLFFIPPFGFFSFSAPFRDPSTHHKRFFDLYHGLPSPRAEAVFFCFFFSRLAFTFSSLSFFLLYA